MKLANVESFSHIYCLVKFNSAAISHSCLINQKPPMIAIYSVYSPNSNTPTDGYNDDNIDHSLTNFPT